MRWKKPLLRVAQKKMQLFKPGGFQAGSGNDGDKRKKASEGQPDLIWASRTGSKRRPMFAAGGN